MARKVSLSNSSVSLRERIKPLGAAVLLIMFSTVAAWATRLLWARLKVGVRDSVSYSAYLESAAASIENILVPMVIAGGLLLGLRYWFVRRYSQHFGFSSGVAAVIGFHVAMVVNSFLIDGPVFPTSFWLLSLFLALVAYSISEVSSSLTPPSPARIAPGPPVHMVIDGTIAGIAFFISYLVRFDGAIPLRFVQQFVGLVLLVVALQVAINSLWNVYAFIWRFTGLKEALVIAESVATASLMAVTIRIAFSDVNLLRVPLGVLLVQPVLTYGGFLGIRIARRWQSGIQIRRAMASSGVRKRLLLVGAGQAGRALARELEHVPTIEVVGFVDDDPLKQRRVVGGIRVLGETADLKTIVNQNGIAEVALCMPSVEARRIREIVAACEAIDVPVSTVPSLSEIVLGKCSISRLRPVQMEDLLGRASIDYIRGDLALCDSYRGACVMVTGAAGSIGSELVRQLREFAPAHLVLVDKDENGLYEVGLEARDDLSPVSEIVADIRSIDKMRRIFSRWQPEIVFHAAAYKHVPLMESNPDEAILNNVLGTRNLVELSADFQVKNFVLVSTDKAVNPTNIMGASKRLAEIIVLRKSVEMPSASFCAVRFGNVLGSRASVVPLFQRQVEEGRNITVTHPEVERYFMTIPEAVQLVIQAGSLGSNGQIFVLDMGDPVRIVDMARSLIELSGLIEGRDIEIEFTGLRPGEKLREELLTASEDGIRITKYPKIFVVSGKENDWADLDELIGELEEAALFGDRDRITALLERAGIGYMNFEEARRNNLGRDLRVSEAP